MRRITYRLLAICAVMVAYTSTGTTGKKKLGNTREGNPGRADIHRPSWLYLRLRGLPRHLRMEMVPHSMGALSFRKARTFGTYSANYQGENETDSCWDGDMWTRHGVCLAVWEHRGMRGHQPGEDRNPFLG